jgi:serine phosphatase RsbU (regulator of sigma subunit)
MNINILQSYKNLIKFIAGETNGLSLENRIFNSSCFLIGIILFLATVINISISINIALTISTAISSIIFFFLYYFSRFKGLFSKLLLPFVVIIYSITILAWFLNAGTKGPIAYSFLFILLIVISISKKKYHLLFISSLILILISLFILEYIFPSLVVQYKNDEIRFIDVTSTLLIGAFLSSFIVMVLKRNYEIERVKAEKKSMLLISSLEYAAHIQEALLESQHSIVEKFSDAFIFYLPKDIVSGDFYWYKKIGNLKLIAAADCTGHGVPGAMMSMLGASYLNEITSNLNEYKANEILNKLREKIKDSLHQNETSKNKDGLDISLCVIDEEKMNLQFSGAVNPIYLVRNKKLTKYRGDRMPIGISYNETPFTNNIIDIEKDDKVYLFTDGFIDQFGGKYGSKFKVKPFQDHLVSISELPMKEQKLSLITTYENWKGKNYDQIDDILLIGIKI